MPKFLKTALGSVVVTILGVVLLLYTDEPPLLCWLTICFFGLGGIVAVIKQLRHYTASKEGTVGRRGRRVLANNINRRNTEMGADAFVAFYGIKIPLDPEDEDTLDACGEETDSRCIAAKRVGLQTHSGRMTDGEDYYLYIGVRLAWLGLENDKYVNVSHDRLIDVMDNVRTKLRAAGFTQQPSLHLQFQGQY